MKRYYVKKTNFSIEPVGKFSKLCLTEKIISEEMMELFIPHPIEIVSEETPPLELVTYEPSIPHNPTIWNRFMHYFSCGSNSRR